MAKVILSPLGSHYAAETLTQNRQFMQRLEGAGSSENEELGNVSQKA